MRYKIGLKGYASYTGDSLIFQKEDNSVKTSDEDYDTINGKAIRKLYYNNSEFAKETKITDKLGRLSESDITNSSGTGLLKRVYSYKNLSGNRTTEQVSGITHVYKDGSTETEAYTYNDYGSLAGVAYADGNKQSFRYDGFGELVQEDDSLQDKSIYYTYTNGNITKKEIYEYSETGERGTLLDEIIYTYGDDEWSDLLTSYDGQSITYDGIGNPLNYMGKTLTWTRGRQLQSVTENGASITYKYDVNGIRTEKQSDGETHEYAYIDGRLHYYEIDGNNMYFTYSDDGTPLAMVYNGVKYYYQTNLQGDVIGLINNSGTKVAEYTYDAWGNPTSSEPISPAGRNNPLRYRGYVYDKDTGWYYLNSRYYNPEVGRFLNADDITYLGISGTALGYNLLAYCENSPTNARDSSGYFGFNYFSIKIYMIAAVTAAVIAAIAKIVGNYSKGYRGWNLFRGVLGASIGSAVNMVLLMKMIKWGHKGLVLAAFAAAAVQCIFDFAEGVIVDKKYSWRQLTTDFIFNFASTYAGNYIGFKRVYINGNWFTPQKIRSFFTKSYGKKLISQTGIGTIISLLIDLIRSGLSKIS